MPSRLGTEDRDALEQDALRAVDLDPVLAAQHGHVPNGHVVGGDDDAAAHDRARLADEPLRVVEDERALVDARREVDDRRLRRPRDLPAAAASTTSAVAATPAPGPTELAAVLAVGEAQRAGSTAWPSTWASSQAPAKNASAAAERRADVQEPCASAMTTAELERAPSGSGGPAGLIREEPVVDEQRRARARRRS